MSQTTKAPTVVELSEIENQGYIMAGTAPEENIEFNIRLILTMGGMDTATAKSMGQKLTAGAIEARAKIAAATRFEIVVVTPPKPSTLLKKPKKTK